MAASGSSLWPALSSGNRARASEVETKFDWLEANVLPMLSGVSADLTYDLGTSTARWNFGNIDKVVCSAINATTTANGVAIGTTTVANSSDVALEVAGIRSFLAPRLTTTQRANLAGINGMVVYDSTLNKFQVYQNGAWTSMGGITTIQEIATSFTLILTNTSGYIVQTTATTVITSVTVANTMVLLQGISNSNPADILSVAGVHAEVEIESATTIRARLFTHADGVGGAGTASVTVHALVVEY